MKRIAMSAIVLALTLSAIGQNAQRVSDEPEEKYYTDSFTICKEGDCEDIVYISRKDVMMKQSHYLGYYVSDRDRVPDRKPYLVDLKYKMVKEDYTMYSGEDVDTHDKVYATFYKNGSIEISYLGYRFFYKREKDILEREKGSVDIDIEDFKIKQ